MQFNNKDKNLHGLSAQHSLYNILQLCKDNGLLADFVEEYRIGMPEYKNKKQFYAPYMIAFNDGSMWLLYTTTSLRTDRVKGQQWDAYNIKAINKSVSFSYIVYEDGLEEKVLTPFLSQKRKYLEKEEYSAIDDIISQDELYSLIEEYATKDKTAGQIKDIQGNNFEFRAAKTLSSQENLRKWKEDPTAVGEHYNLFITIIRYLKLSTGNVKDISATSDKHIIGKIQTGGNPKTDIIMQVNYCNGNTDTITISCKRTNSSTVSVHEYTADAFADVLDADNDVLRDLLKKFQAAGSYSAFGETNSKLLTQELLPYKRKLMKWVLGGDGGEVKNESQIAKYILTYNNNTFSFHSIDEYCDLLESDTSISGGFGTPFSWTYPSKKREKSIQLKCKILM